MVNKKIIGKSLVTVKNGIRGFAPIRWERVIEIRGILNQFKFLSKAEKLTLILEEIREEKNGLSSKEFSLLLRPNKVNADGTPTYKAIDDTKRDLAHFRHIKSNPITPCYVKLSNGMIVFYGVQVKRQYGDMLRLKGQVKQGCDDRTQNDLENIAQPKTIKEKMIEKTKLAIIAKNRNKQDGDYQN